MFSPSSQLAEQSSHSQASLFIKTAGSSFLHQPRFKTVPAPPPAPWRQILTEFLPETTLFLLAAAPINTLISESFPGNLSATLSEV